MDHWTRFDYAAGNVAGWAGWYEDEDGNARAFIGVDGEIVRVEDIAGMPFIDRG